jgi:MFS family permease
VWICETFGFYGFASWVPSLLKSSGITIEKTLWYNVLQSIGAPLGALIGAIVSEKFQRKWILAFSAFLTAIAGLLYSKSRKADCFTALLCSLMIFALSPHAVLCLHRKCILGI